MGARVRLLGISCDKCGPVAGVLLPGNLMPSRFPVVLDEEDLEFVRNGDGHCLRCKGPGCYITEPVAPTPAEAQRG